MRIVAHVGVVTGAIDAYPRKKKDVRSVKSVSDAVIAGTVTGAIDAYGRIVGAAITASSVTIAANVFLVKTVAIDATA